MRGHLSPRVLLWEHTDVQTLWAIYCAGEYLVERTDEIVVDVGANVGLFALYATQQAPAARVFCFEPVKSTFERLSKQVAQWPHRARIDCRQQGVAGEVGQRTISIGRGSQTATLHPDISNDVEQREMIVVTTLERILEDVTSGAGRASVSCVKIDCEGAEWEIFEATPLPLLRRVDRFCVEYHLRGSYTEAWLTERLASAGFARLRVHRRARTGTAWYARR